MNEKNSKKKCDLLKKKTDGQSDHRGAPLLKLFFRKWTMKNFCTIIKYKNTTENNFLNSRFKNCSFALKRTLIYARRTN